MGSRGQSLGKGGGGNVNIQNETDVWSFRHNQNNAAFVDEMNEGVRKIQDDFPDIMNDVNFVMAGTLGGADKTGILGYYNRASKTVALNDNYTNVEKMNSVYDGSNGFHPSRGNLSGTQAVALHEMGHALNDHIAKKMGVDMDTAAATVVKNAYKASGAKGGNRGWAGEISGYAQKNYAEAVAEAVADVYCNGNNAAAASKGIMNELNKYR